MRSFRLWPACVFALLFSFTLTLSPTALWAQAGSPAGNTVDPASYIGMSMSELLGRFGPPRSVYAVRGIEEWQDDVVFVYDDTEFYILKDMVWQLGLKSAYLVSSGDPGSAAYLSFGDAVISGRDYAVFPLRGHSWPMALRCNFDSAGRVAAIFIYRSDL